MARRKITEPAEQIAGDDLPELTAQQMAFVEGILAGKTATAAYRAAYNAENMLDSTIWAAASRLRADCKVAAWLSAARQAHLGNVTVTLEEHLRELDRLKELAIGAGNMGAAIQAEQLRGKARGHYVEQTVDLTAANDPERILAEIAELAGPEFAEALARQSTIKH